MTLRPGEVVLIRIEFYQTPGGKLRPAVVLLDSADDVFVAAPLTDRKSTRLNSSHLVMSYAVCCLKKKATMPMFALMASARRYGPSGHCPRPITATTSGVSIRHTVFFFSSAATTPFSPFP